MSDTIISVPLRSLVAAPFERRQTGDVSGLASSIREIGLLNPITVTATDDGRFHLIAGAQRVEAYKLLGRDTIPATVTTLDGLRAELAIIDENLMRNNGTPLEFAENTTRRKEIYEQLYPETKRGVAGGNAGGRGRPKEIATDKMAVAIQDSLPTVAATKPTPSRPSFAADQAMKTGASERTVRRAVEVATKIAAPVRERIHEAHGAGLPINQTELLQIASLDKPEQQHEVVERVIQGEAKTITQAVREVRREARQAEAAAAPPPPRDLPARIEVGDAMHLPLAEGEVDLICMSPPYGLDKAYGADGDVPADEWPSFMRAWLTEALRVTRPGGRLALNVPLDTSEPTFRPTYAQAVQAAVEAGWTYRFCAVWNEGTTSKSTGWGSVFAPHVIARVEMIAVFHKPGKWTREGNADLTLDELMVLYDGLWKFAGETRAYADHPAPYPEELPRRLIKLLTGPGDVVLDPFSGSGTTALSAWRLGRKAIGFDKEQRWVDAARRRLAQAIEEDGNAPPLAGVVLLRLPASPGEVEDHSDGGHAA